MSQSAEPDQDTCKCGLLLSAHRSIICEWRIVHHDGTQVLNANPLATRLKAFGRDCVLNGDMTPAAERMLLQILEEHG